MDEMVAFELVDEDQAQEMLDGQEVQGVLTIENGIAEKLTNKQQAIQTSIFAWNCRSTHYLHNR